MIQKKNSPKVKDVTYFYEYDETYNKEYICRQGINNPLYDFVDKLSITFYSFLFYQYHKKIMIYTKKLTTR